MGRILVISIICVSFVIASCGDGASINTIGPANVTDGPFLVSEPIFLFDFSVTGQYDEVVVSLEKLNLVISSIAR